MNQHQFFDLLSGNYSSIEGNSEILENAILEYPYFSNLHVIKALVLHDEQSEGFTEALHKAAARTISQRRLKELVEGPLVLELEWETRKETLETDGTDNRWAEESGREIDPAGILEAGDLENSEPEILAIEVKDEEISDELPPPKNEFGFKFIRKAKIKRANKTGGKLEPVFDIRSLENKKSVAKKGNRDAIDQFLEKSPSISSPAIDFGQNIQLPDLAAKSVALGEEIVTENMALIYMKQRNFARALNIYRKLELKFPEKKAYFAALIKNLENTIV